jgi:hypothetical protein
VAEQIDQDLAPSKPKTEQGINLADAATEIVLTPVYDHPRMPELRDLTLIFPLWGTGITMRGKSERRNVLSAFAS